MSATDSGTTIKPIIIGTDDPYDSEFIQHLLDEIIDSAEHNIFVYKLLLRCFDFLFYSVITSVYIINFFSVFGITLSPILFVVRSIENHLRIPDKQTYMYHKIRILSAIRSLYVNNVVTSRFTLCNIRLQLQFLEEMKSCLRMSSTCEYILPLDQGIHEKHLHAIYAPYIGGREIL